MPVSAMRAATHSAAPHEQKSCDTDVGLALVFMAILSRLIWLPARTCVAHRSSAICSRNDCQLMSLATG